MSGILGALIGSYKPAATSSFESIATVTAAGGETSISFTSIPSTYKHLQIRGLAKDTTNNSDDAGYSIRFNSDTGSNYAMHRLRADGTNIVAGGNANQSSMSLSYGAVASASGVANMFGVSIVDIHDYASTTKNKTMRAFSGSNINSTGTTTGIALDSGLWMNKNAITSNTLLPDLTAFAAGTDFSLYGIK